MKGKLVERKTISGPKGHTMWVELIDNDGTSFDSGFYVTLGHDINFPFFYDDFRSIEEAQKFFNEIESYLQWIISIEEVQRTVDQMKFQLHEAIRMKYQAIYK